MPDLYFVAFEIIQLALLGLCLRHAARLGPAAIWQLGAGVIFGLLLEAATLRQLQAYRYGTFLMMLGDVPALVGVGWGVIIYSARLFADATSLPEWARPVLEGLLALNVDLAMDAVALRLGMWDWGLGRQAQYFGVPFTNFWAWFWVVLTFSVGLRMLARPATWVGRWLGPAAAIGFGLANLLAMNTLLTLGVPATSYRPMIAVMLGAAVGLLVWLRPAFSRAPLAPPAVWVPFVFHAFFLAAGLVSGALLDPPILLLTAVAMAGAAVYLHRHSLRALAGAPARPGP